MGTDLQDSPLEVDPDAPVRYMQRTRDWYLAMGYDNPYQEAHHGDVPFTRLGMPVSAARVALITTAAPYQPDKGPQGAGGAGPDPQPGARSARPRAGRSDHRPAAAAPSDVPTEARKTGLH